jgi:ATP-dependent Clp protease ATP-binding subunit ClpA
VFERFTERARQVVVVAQDEARVFRHKYIGTEHLLLGLLGDDDALAARVLESLGVKVDDVRAKVVEIVGGGDEVTTGQIPFTPRAKKVLELSHQEALALRHNYIGTEHLLLGLVRENEGVATRILVDLGADAPRVRAEIVRMLGGGAAEDAPSTDELAAELEEVRRAKEAAIDDGQFERAASLRDNERRLRRRLQGLPDVEPVELMEFGGRRVRIGHGPVFAGRMPRRIWTYPAALSATPLLAGWLLFGFALGCGILLGWLIWG